MLEGATVMLNTDYFEFIKENPDIATVTVYTGEIDKFYGYRFGALEWRAVRFETETVDTDNYQGNAVVNYTEASVPYTRIIEHKHFDGAVSEKTVISREYSREWKVGEEPYYPINNDRNNELYARYEELARAEKSVIFGGRLGTYKYYDMDKVIRAALDTVREALER
jgi:UDP-galactopyranose mutase